MQVSMASISKDQQTLSECVASGALSIHYQAILSTQDASVRGAEALVRIHENDCEQATRNYLHIAHSTGLIEDIDRWVIAESCKQIAHWNRTSNHPLLLFVNVSEPAMAEADFPDFIEAMLENSGLAYGELNLEINEGAFYNPACVSNARMLREKGVKVTLDNVGKRDASTILFPNDVFDSYKLDKKLFSGDENKEKIVRYLKALEKYGAKPVAVGVEGKPDLKLCQELNIELFQGFYAAQPLPSQDFESWFVGARG